MAFCCGEPKILGFKENIGIQVANHVEVQVRYPSAARVECTDLSCKISLPALRHANQFHPGIFSRVTSHDVVRAVGGTVANDYPFERSDGLRHRSEERRVGK